VLVQDKFEPSNPSRITVSELLARFGYIIISARIAALSFLTFFVIGMVLGVTFSYSMAKKYA